MIELPDDELDKLFRKSSEELDPTYEPDDWNDLRKRLDQQDGRTPGGWWRKWWPLGVLAVLIPVGVWLYSVKGENGGKEDGGRENVLREEGRWKEGGKEDGRRKEGTKQDVASEQLVGRSGGVPESGTVKDAATAGEKVNVGRTGDRNARVMRSQKDISLKQNIDNEWKTSEQEAGKSSSLSDLNAASGKSKSSALLPRSRSKAGGVFLEPNRSTVEGGDGAFSKTNTHSGEAANGVAAPAELERTTVTASELNGKALKWSLLTLPGIAMPVYEVPEPAAPPKQSSMSAGDEPLAAVRFGYSPDLSTVGLKDFSKPGTAVSLLVEYAVLPRLYVQSGVVWSRKVYYASAEAYKLPKLPHFYPPKMSGIDGVCKVLEVPVSLRYDISSRQRSRWFGSAGLSSYHMNDEKYKYYFVDPNDPNAAKYPGWKGKTGWYWFSHASISAGYEYRISRKLSLLAEPSVRLPLRRVGFGNVNLITTGLWLSVRYTPVFK